MMARFLVAFVFMLVLAGGGIWYAYETGHAKGISECHEALLRSERDAAAKALNDLRAQYKAQGKALAALKQKGADIARDLALARAQASLAPVAKDCSLGPDAVRALNLARTGNQQ